MRPEPNITDFFSTQSGALGGQPSSIQDTRNITDFFFPVLGSELSVFFT
jgi:hypothetical protein